MKSVKNSLDIKKVKEKLKKLATGCLGLIKKLNRKAAIAAVAVLILGSAVLLNFLMVPKSSNIKTGGGLKVKTDLSDVSAAIADKESKENESDGNNKVKDAFAEMSLSRRQARDEALEVLNGVAASSTAIDSMKEEAMGELQQIAKDIESEANIESLVMAKGYEQCVAVVNGDSASIVIKTDGLLENEVAQISEIVWQQAGVHPDKLKIIESN